MYQALQITNFRAFQSLRIDGLRRVNLFTGRNNAGKTSVLEALYLLEGRPAGHRVQRLFETRGLASTGFTQFSARTMPWSTLFYELDVAREIELTGTTEGGDRRLQLRTELSAEDRDYLATAGAPENVDRVLRNVLMTAVQTSGRPQRRAIWVENGKIHPVSTQEETPYLAASTRPSHLDLARYLDELELVKETRPIVEALQLIDPRLTGLRTLMNAGPSIIHADLGGAALLPLAVVGDGILRILEIVFAMLQGRTRAVLIDEIETGLHYSVLPSVWGLIHRLAKQNNVQVFAVTHSRECTVAAHEAAMQSGDYDFRHYRLEQKDGAGRAVAYSEENLQTSIETELEFR